MDQDIFQYDGLDISYAGDPNFHYGRSASRNAQPFRGTVLHHTGVDVPIENTVEYGKRVDQERGGAFGYHFYIGNDGRIIQGAPLSRRTNHILPDTGDHGLRNHNAIGISLQGDGTNETEAQRQAAIRLNQALAETYGFGPDSVFGHAEVQSNKARHEGVELADLVRAALNGNTEAQAILSTNQQQMSTGGVNSGALAIPEVQQQSLDAQGNPVSMDVAALANGAMASVGQPQPYLASDMSQHPRYMGNAEPSPMLGELPLAPGAQPALPALSGAPVSGPAGVPPQGGGQGPAPQDDPQGLWERLSSGIQNIDERQWLAMGTGLLAGDDWQSGFAQASENLFGVENDDVAFQRDQQMALMDHAMRMERGAQSAANSASMYSETNPYLMKDGSVQQITYDRTSGSYLYPDGSDASADIQHEVNNSFAGGDRSMPTFKQITDTTTELNNTRATLDTFDRVYGYLNDSNYGIEGFTEELGIYYNTLLGQGLSDQEIARRAASGELQGLLGGIREQIVGGGVMTEQDAERVIAALGGNVSTILSNPEVGRRLLATRRRDLLRNYETQTGFFDSTRQTFPQLRLPEIDPYVEPEGLYDEDGWDTPRGSNSGALDSSNGPTFDVDEIDQILQQNGV